jgi:parallel beta-helix repeat protein
MAWVKWGSGSDEGLNDLNVNKSLATTGRGKYGLETPRVAGTPRTEGTVWFHLEYVPFAIFNDAMWSSVSGGKVTERPVWVIRNGLNDAKQEAATWTSGMAYNGTNGGIAIGVVDPAAPFTAGLFEDNNPWPIPGTEGKTSADILAWLTASPITTVKTLAGIKGEGQGKYGTYTLLPRRYYAAPLSGSEPSGGLTGIAAKGGATWQDASSDIQKLVTLAQVNYELAAQPIDIWAAAGTYTASSGSGTVISLTADNQRLGIYGGFKGTETAAIGSLPAGRDGWFNTYGTFAAGNKYGTLKTAEAARETILDGVSGVDSGTAGSTVIVSAAADLVLDGFTITHSDQSGSADFLNGLALLDVPETTLFTNLNVSLNKSKYGTSYTNRYTSGSQGGGGIFIEGGAPRLSNITVDGNTVSSDWGGGIWIVTSEPQITNARVSNNTASGRGGGIGTYYNSRNDVPNFKPKTSSYKPRLVNIVVTGNVSSGSAGGGIYLNGSGHPYSSPYLQNIIVTGNTAWWSGSAIQNEALSLIVNALVSGNSLTTAGDTGSDNGQYGGALYLTGEGSVIVNALVSGNKTVSSNDNPNVGGGIKVLNGALKLINCTVSGNYLVGDNGATPLPGAGIVVFSGHDQGSMVEVYNSLVLGNTGDGTKENDVRLINKIGNDTPRISYFTAFNSLLAGYTAVELNAGVAITGDVTTTEYPGSGNVNGAAYAGPLVPSGFFTAFNALPSSSNTGAANVAAWTTTPQWNFRLSSPPPGVVDGGSASWLTEGFTSVSFTYSYGGYGTISTPNPGGVTTDLAGSSRTQGGGMPDLGAYESASIGVPIPTYTVTNLKPQSDSAGNHGHLTVSTTAQAGSVVTVTAIPTTSYTLGSITCRTASGVTVPVTTTGTTGTFTMPAENVTVDATFTYSVSGGGGFAGAYTVTNLKPQSDSAGNHGHLTVSSSTAQAGAEVIITATLATDYTGTVTCRTAGGASVSITTIDSTHGKFTMPSENVTVDATFTSSVGGGGGFSGAYTVTNLKPQSDSAANHGYLSVSSSTAQAGAEVTITATSATDYAGTVTCGTASGVPVSITTIDSTHGKFTMPSENVTVDATFTYSVSGGGGFGGAYY